MRVTPVLLVVLLLLPGALPAPLPTPEPADVVVGFVDALPEDPAAFAAAHGAAFRWAMRGLPTMVVRAPDPEAFVAAMSLDPRVAHARVDSPGIPLLSPRDVRYVDQQDLMEAVAFPAAWDAHRGDRRVLVALPDTGVQIDQPDLRPNFWPVSDGFGFDYLGDDGQPSGVVEDLVPEDVSGHGTAVASVMASVLDNGTGLAGGANVSLMILRTGPSWSVMTQGVLDAVAAGADVIVIAHGWPDEEGEPDLARAIEIAMAAGVVVVAAGGDGQQGLRGGLLFPASMPGVIAVTGLARVGGSLVFDEEGSSQGATADLSAPAVGVPTAWSADAPLPPVACSTSGREVYCASHGTSFAAPQVAAVAALMLSCHPRLTNIQVADILNRTANDVRIGGAPTDWDPQTGWGSLDAAEAVTFGGECGTDELPPPAPTVNTVLASFQDATAFQASGLWNRQGRQGLGGPDVWYFGVPGAFTYDTGARVAGALTTPPIPIPEGTAPRVSFQRWEDVDAAQDAVRVVEASTDGGATWTEIHRSTGDVPRAWVTEDAALPAEAVGRAALLRFRFDSVDASGNGHEGWYVGNVRVYQPGVTQDVVVETTSFSGVPAADGCYRKVFDAEGAAIQGLRVTLTPPPGVPVDLSLKAPGGARTGGWTCGDLATRQGIPSSAYSGPSATQQWVQVEPVTGRGAWTVVVRAPAGTTVSGTIETYSRLPFHVRYGQDTVLQGARANAGQTGNCVGGSSCASAPAQGLASASQSATGGPYQTSAAQNPPATASVGWRFVIEPSCAAQQARGVASFVMPFSSTLATTASGDSVAQAAIQYQQDGGTPVSIRSRINGAGDASQASDSYTVGIPIALGSFVTTSLGAYASAQGGVLQGGATASAEVRYGDARISFGDARAPDYTSVLTPSAGDVPVAASGGFLGWYHRPVSLGVTASDVPVSPTEVFSCVESVQLADAASPASSRSLYPGPAQTPVGFTYAEDARHDVTITVRDYNGNVQPRQDRFQFGVDANPPTTLLTLSPGAPTGLAGWYKGGAPRIFLACSDSASGCASTWLDGASPAAWSAQDAAQGRVAPEGVSTFAYHSVDVAANVEALRPSFTLKVDSRAPTLQMASSVVAGADADWYPAEPTVALACSDPLPGSGCSSTSVALDGGGAVSPAPSQIVIAGEGLHTLAWSAEDAAGNLDGGARQFNVDLQDPPAPTLLAPADGFLTNAASVAASWTSVADNGPAGIARYEVAVDGVVTQVSGTSRALALADGAHCVKARAVDRAGRAGPWSAEACGVVDRVAPAVTLPAPKGGFVTTATGATVALGGLASDTAIVVGDVHATAAAADVGLAGLASLRVLNALDAADAGVTCSASPCSHDVAFQGVTSDLRSLRLDATATDRAGNAATASRHVRQVTLNGYAQRSGSSWLGVVDWAPYTGSGTLVRYEIHRSTVADFVATELTRVGTSVDGSLRFQETLSPSTTYHYRIRYVLESSFIDSYTATVKTGAPSTGGGGGGDAVWDGRYGSCGTLACKELPLLMYDYASY